MTTTKTVTALDSLDHFRLKLRPCILNGKVSGKGVTVKVTKYEKDHLDNFLKQFNLTDKVKVITGGTYLVCVIPIDDFNAATAAIEEKAPPPPLDLSEFENNDENAEDEENEDEETDEEPVE